MGLSGRSTGQVIKEQDPAVPDDPRIP